ncbi:MAG TPA: pyridoxamine 5'-phosphate oxidase family protein [Methanotrichaceae archaeon]|nr:MAG: Pyridoxamine 5'-phosphate oxidase [Methanosaeta sp. PtaU1.Bin028]HOT07076.1 pyridoxamine 5'-phosphate oxidase family protein [Methanotrichaceae archaeon]HQF17089.1 pyridoxamine 5'-phosphate oxidase family protein [Methanotrichaceae archaeon]HQI91710.1 pyridoxamine 5'-phosphate oxidase family protein [Methanotrichaceae archaeon]HQJ28933.1 pyridoxamine 5'-phosphate oxidase family protein [Methanotrichaceae archaeon]
MAQRLMEYFNRQPRLGVISTSSKDGRVDCAVYGSPQMIDERTVMVALANGRTFANLLENPNAVFMIMEEGAKIMEWKGVRVYLKMREHVTSGQQLDAYKSQVASIIGEQAADMIKVLAWFDVTEVRPLIDFGQGWEKSI